MFIVFIAVLAMSLASLASHLYITLALQAETVTATCNAFKYEQFCQGTLCYAVSYLVHSAELREEIALRKETSRSYERWNTLQDGNVSGKILYKLVPNGYSIEIKLYCHEYCMGGLHAVMACQEDSTKKLYSCVAIEAF